MMGYMTDAQREALELALTRWAEQRRASDDSRDDLVRTAVSNGVPKHRVHILTGIARTTIDKIVSDREGDQQ